MSDAFYAAIRWAGRFPLWVSSSPVTHGAQHIPTSGPFLIAATHQSPFDVPIIIRHVRRHVDFVSITEVFQRPFLGWFYGHLNAFPLDRGRADPATVRIILDRLAKGRVVAIFPEGRIRAGAQSVVHTGAIRTGVGRIASLAGVPVLPCVIENSSVYARPASWLPLRRARYGIAFGPCITQPLDPAELEHQLVAAFRALHSDLTAALPPC